MNGVHKLIKDLTGERFGKLIVLNRALSNSKSGNARWTCRCDCGSFTTVTGSKLINKHTTSCGCNKRTANGHSTERLFRIWNGMKRRCLNEKSDNYKWYGGRGISICSEWDEYEAFRSWAIKAGYSDALTIDRINPNGNYTPENCKWVDIKAQANNRNNNHILKLNGETYTISQFAEKYRISYWTVVNRLKLGWDLERIIRTPERSVDCLG
ncbi:hypothetical protein Sgly_0324 [Syntrophobotulus glycolicus DSM 8271]|uniref:HNH endonuclease n=1 Tax=Syntrophobotulus glycolicus (strain DSM 8271 / FlGlyR) TaxID=645991 RepID=F0SXE4_SYNGF|nr:hypothetical protein Sgly_0324 [Syntrophobotulus glycolicus DSM 8271]